MKTLILKPRLKDADGNANWHDKYVLGNALQHIAKGKDLMKLAPWISIAGKIEEAAEETELGKETKDNDKTTQHLPELKIEIRNQEAHLLWENLKKLNFDDYGSPLMCRKCGAPVNSVPNVGTLYQMLTDIAAACGESIPEADEDEDEKPTTESE